MTTRKDQKLFEHKWLSEYQRGGFNKIQGWVDPNLIELFAAFAALPFNHIGGVAEIGVYHGRFFILLNQLTEQSEKSLAVDIWDNQALNSDGSGAGSTSYLESFRQNLLDYDRHRGSNTHVVAGDSTTRAVGREIINAVGEGAMRYVSVDGGHSREHVLNDLRLAEILVADEGVVILDDITNGNWPGVMEGAITYLQSLPPLRPIAIGHNKLFLARITQHTSYLEAMADWGLSRNLKSLCGSTVWTL